MELKDKDEPSFLRVYNQSQSFGPLCMGKNIFLPINIQVLNKMSELWVNVSL